MLTSEAAEREMLNADRLLKEGRAALEASQANEALLLHLDAAGASWRASAILIDEWHATWAGGREANLVRDSIITILQELVVSEDNLRPPLRALSLAALQCHQLMRLFAGQEPEPLRFPSAAELQALVDAERAARHPDAIFTHHQAAVNATFRELELAWRAVDDAARDASSLEGLLRPVENLDRVASKALATIAIAANLFEG